MRNYDKEAEWEKKKYKRLTFKVDREKYNKLEIEQQKTISQKAREFINEFLNRPT